MIATKYWKSYYEDNFVLRVITHDGKRFSQGKRLSNGASKQLKKIQKAYVKNGAVSAVKLIREEQSLSLHDSLKTLRVLLGTDSVSFRWTHL